jgi:hypothetical protein
MEGHQAAGSEVESFEWVSEPVVVRNEEVNVVYRSRTDTRIDDVALVDAQGQYVAGVVIEYVQVGNVMLLAFTKRHRTATPEQIVTVCLGPETVTLMDQPPTRMAAVRIRGVRVRE